MVKKYFISNRPRGVEMYLFEVTRLTVNSCMSIASATSFSVMGLRNAMPRCRNSSCWRTISVATLRMVCARWSRLLVSQLAVCRQSTRKLFSVASRVLPVTRGVVGAVDQHARQDVGVELDQPARRTLAHEHVGHHRLDRPALEGAAGLRIERPQFGQHVEQIVAVGADGARQRDEIVVGDQLEIVEQPLHHRVEPVALAQLDGEALLAPSGRTAPSGSSVCSLASTALDQLQRRAELFGDGVEIERQVAGFVKAIGKEARDDLFGRVGQQQADLLVEVIGERRTRRDELIDVGGLAALAHAAAACPVGAEPVLAALLWEDVLDFGVETVGDAVGILDALTGLDGVVVADGFGRRFRACRPAPCRPRARAADCAAVRCRQTH